MDNGDVDFDALAISGNGTRTWRSWSKLQSVTYKITARRCRAGLRAARRTSPSSSLAAHPETASDGQVHRLQRLDEDPATTRRMSDLVVGGHGVPTVPRARRLVQRASSGGHIARKVGALLDVARLKLPVGVRVVDTFEQPLLLL